MPRAAVIIPGDGVGPEVTGAAREVLDAAGADLAWDVREVGQAAWEKGGDALPPPVVEAIRDAGVALKGPVGTPVGGPFRSVNVALREALDLHTGIRPVRSADGRLDVVIVRMNTEDLYAGHELRASDDLAVAFKFLSRPACERTAREAFALARASGRARVTAVHKATAMPLTDGLFLEAVRTVAEDFPDVELDDRLVDTVAAELVTKPERFGVLVMPMLYGDVLSDLAAALGGGLGLAPGANLGPGCAVFEAVHGTAMRHAGRGTANPAAAILCGALLLRHVGQEEAAARVEAAVRHVVAGAGAAAGTRGITDAVITRLTA